MEEFVASDLSLVREMTVQEILTYTDNTGISNLDRVYDAYTLEQQREFSAAFQSGTLSTLNVGTLLALPKDRINNEPLIGESNAVLESISAQAFVAEKLRELEEDPDFTQIYQPEDEANGVTKEMYPNVTVWIWSRALANAVDSQGEDVKELPGTIIDVSKFVTNVSTSTAGQGGDFQLQLPAITGEWNEETGWQIRQDLISNNDHQTQRDYTYEDVLNRDDRRSTFYFHNILQENDLVFIRFEVLQNETLRRNFPNDFIVNNSELPGNTYDMIGLIDSNTVSIDPETNLVSINVAGRDLMKLFIEDGAYVYPEQFGINAQLKDNQDNNSLRQRLFSNGGLTLLSSFVKRPIDFTVLFVVNQLANIGVIPNDLLQSYGEDRSRRFNLEELGNPQTLTETVMQGIWQICKFVFDESIADRRVVDSSISFANGSLINYINKVCQDPWVQFYGDTYGDQYTFITRQPPFTREGFISLIPPEPTPDDPFPYGNIRDEDVIAEDLQFDNENAFSWYRLRPQAQLNGIGDGITLAFVPAVYFDRYADIWGSRPYDVVSNYVNYVPRTGDKESLQKGYYDQQIIHDLKFIIDSNAYLPFTRRGTITINGDRRFKKGTVVRHLGTGEVFYVDAVTQDYTISQNGVDRVTILQVSRGMVERYVTGGKPKRPIPLTNTRAQTSPDGTNQNFAHHFFSDDDPFDNDSISAEADATQNAPNSPQSSGGSQPIPTYWDIVDTSIKKAFEQTRKNSSLDIKQLTVNIQSNWKVNDRVFNFFWRREQFRQ